MFDIVSFNMASYDVNKNI